MRKWRLAASMLLAASAAFADDLQTKVALEASLEQRLKSVISDLIGSENAVAIVHATLQTVERSEGRDEVLPGVPAKDLSSAGPRTTSTISKLAVTLIVEDGLSDADVAGVRKAAADLVGLDEKRGDTLEVRKQRFADRQTRLEGPFTLERLFKPPHLWNVTWLMLALIAILTLPRGLAGAVRLLAEAVRGLQHMETASKKEVDPFAAAMAAGGPAPSPGLAPRPLPTGEGARRAGEGESKRDNQPFGFVTARHLPRLIYLLKKSPPEIIAVVVHYIPTEMAAHVLGALDAPVRQAVAHSLGHVVELTEGNVRKIEQYIASKIDFLVGGEDRLLEILDEATPEEQVALLDSLSQRDPQLAESLRRQVVRIEDLGDLDSTEIQHVMRRFPLNILGALLLGHPEVLQKMAAKLPQGLAQRLTQEVDLARPLPHERRVVEAKHFIDTLKELWEEGWISLKKPAEAQK